MCVRTYVGVCFKDSGHFRLLFEGYKTLLASILALLEATYEPGLRTFLKGIYHYGHGVGMWQTVHSHVYISASVWRSPSLFILPFLSCF